MQMRDFFRKVKYYLMAHALSRGLFKRMEDKKFLRFYSRVMTGRALNTEDPKTYTEKLQWLKLYDRRDQYTRMADKCEAKEYIEEKIGPGHTAKVIGVWDKTEDIDFDVLPESFVLKCTHCSGGMLLCRNKTDADLSAAIKEINSRLKENYYYRFREWPYKNIHPRVIAEEYLQQSESKTETLTDYKFFCFNGEPKIMYIAKENSKADDVFFYDMDFNRLPDIMYRSGSFPPAKPETFEEMKTIAAKLSAGVPHLRVDLYEINGRVYCGELTFFPNAGFAKLISDEWENKMGGWIELPEKNII